MIELQRKLLGDRIRNRAFADALKKVIKPGKSVVTDIGSGTGFLSFVASGYGAKECHLYEPGEVLEISRAIAQVNGIKNCRFIPMHSTSVKNPVKADIVVSETLGNFALEENIIENMNDAKRFLKSGGTLIPFALKQFACPVVYSRLHNDINVWSGIGYGLDFGLAKKIAMNNMYVKTIRPADLLGLGKAAQVFDLIDFKKRNKSIRSSSVDWSISKPVTVFGFAVWWEAQLVPGITLSTSPLKPPTHWEQIYLPLIDPVGIAKGDKLELGIKSDSRYEVKINVEWVIIKKDRRGKPVTRQEFDMRRGQID